MKRRRWSKGQVYDECCVAVIRLSARSVRLRQAAAARERPGRSSRTGRPRTCGFASALTEAEWQTRLPRDGRKIGVVVHHVASVYPVEIQLAQTVAGGKPVTGVTWDDVHEMNAGHAQGQRRRHEGSHARVCSGATARPPRPRSGRSATRSSIGQRRCRSTPMLHSRPSSCSRITPSGTAITTSPGSNGR